MTINELKPIADIEKTTKVGKAFLEFEKVLIEIRKRELPERLVLTINKYIDDVNSATSSGIVAKKLIKKTQSQIIKLLEKEIKVVPKNYYQGLWMALGMASFGLPVGVALGTALGNIGLMAIGLPIGLAIGTMVGNSMDKKALDEGRQLDVEVTF